MDPSGAMALRIGTRRLAARWVGRGGVREVNSALALRPKPDVLVGSELSGAARRMASSQGVGWVDESGAAELTAGTIIISRSGSPRPRRTPPPKWTPAVLAVAEALLCGVQPTESRTAAATGHSTSTTARALTVLISDGLLESPAARGRGSGRRVIDADRLLSAYADAADTLRPRPALTCGVLWRDPVDAVRRLGRRWDNANLSWAATGALAAAVLAPLLTEVPAGELYVVASGDPELHVAAREAGLEPMTGGRLTLRPFPTAASRNLASEIDGIRVAPWPRVYADLREVGVRGEEAAEHLRELSRG